SPMAKQKSSSHQSSSPMAKQKNSLHRSRPTAKQQYQITKNLLKRKLKCKRVRRQAVLRQNGNKASSEKKQGLLLWICKPTKEVNIYNEFEAESKKRILTPACIEHALTFVKSPGFCVFDLPTSSVMFFDAHNNN
ncbi:hypothetical protein PSTT_02180, partial [Puccinia striiformis]